MGSFDEKEHEKPFLPPPVSAAGAYPKQQGQPSPTLILLVVAFYWIISLAVVFLNKFILSSSEYSFPYPLFVTWFQLVVALVVLLAWGSLGKRFKSFNLIPPFEFDLTIARKVAPLTFMYIMMLAFNNLCLQYVEVTFYQVARSLSIVFNIIFTYVILNAKTSFPSILACGVVFVGFVIGSYGEVRFSWQGVIYGVTSSAFVALYGIYVKKTLPVLDNNQWRLLHYNTALSIVALFPIVLCSGEPSQIYMDAYFIDEIGFWILMTFTGITGFIINIAMFLQIKFTTPLTTTISGTAKSCVQTALAAWYFQNPISALNGLGIFLALFGSGLYSWIRYKEMIHRSIINK